MQSEYETPGAMRGDIRSLVDEARALLEATSNTADEKISQARDRLLEALEGGNGNARLRERAIAGARAADRVVRDHPYETLGVAFGIGVLLGCLVMRRG